MVDFSVIEKKDINVGARVNKELVELLKEADIPISLVLKSALIFFFTLDDNEKVRFIEKYDINKISGELKYAKLTWDSMKEKYGGQNQ